MKSLHNRIKLFFLLCLLNALNSCQKFVDIGEPKSSIIAERVFSDSINANAAIVGSVYSGGPAVNGGAFLSISGGLASDEIYPTGTSAGNIGIYSNALNSSNSQVGILWNAYSAIYRVNACIEGLEKSDLINRVKDQFLGECKFFRALQYFYLSSYFGSVPLVITTDYTKNEILPCESKENIFKQIVKDLEEAKELLRDNYLTAGRFRANKYAAKALLSRVYLYLGRWNEAVLESTDVINNSSLYNLEKDLSNVFLSSSKEAILQLVSTGSISSQNFGVAPEATAFVPSSVTVIPPYVLSDTLFRNFEPNDSRKTKWIAKNTILASGVPKDYFYPAKFKIRTATTTPSMESLTIIRLGELYLIRAEARAQLNSVTSGMSDLNVIRNRANLSSLSNLTKDQLLFAVLAERQHEFFCEWGHRWLDLNRTGLSDTYMPGITTLKNGTWTPNWKLWPIPQSALNDNPFLVQNPGY